MRRGLFSMSYILLYSPLKQRLGLSCLTISKDPSIHFLHQIFCSGSRGAGHTGHHQFNTKSAIQQKRKKTQTMVFLPECKLWRRHWWTLCRWLFHHQPISHLLHSVRREDNLSMNTVKSRTKMNVCTIQQYFYMVLPCFLLTLVLLASLMARYPGGRLQETGMLNS